jgi:hypothetical protein
MHNSNENKGVEGSQGFTNLPDYSMEHLSYYKEAVFFKRYHKKLSADKAAADAAMVCTQTSLFHSFKVILTRLTQNSTIVTEEPEAVVEPEPAGQLIDEGPMSDEEIATLNPNIAAMNVYMTRPYRYHIPEMALIDYTVKYTPSDIASNQRTVLMENLPAETDPELIVRQYIQENIRCDVISVKMENFKFKGADGETCVYSANSALVVFEKATDAKAFVEQHEVLDTILLLDSATNPHLGKY